MRHTTPASQSSSSSTPSPPAPTHSSALLPCPQPMASRRARQRYRRRVRKRRILRYCRGPTVDPRILPPRPPNVCRFCWRGPCAAGSRSMPARLSESRWEGTTYEYAVSFAGLRDRARRGCVWCRALAKETRARDPYRQPDNSISFPFLGILGVRIHFAGRVHVGISPDYPEHPFGLQAHAFGDDPTAGVTPWCPLLIDVGSLRALTFAKECIERCSGEHSDCRSCLPTSPSTLPTRLIDCRDVNRPRLVTTTPGANGKYVALSYVWGGPQDKHHTTENNMAAYHDGIDATTLPQTIRDAIYITRALGIDSLWLDSLCIIQDSAKDKHCEMASMRHIYRNAYVTIIAASASSVTEGFLHERRLRPVVASLPALCSPAESTGEPRKQATGIRAPPHLVGTLHLIACTESEPEEPIDERAWCLQELLMSPRALIFTSETVVFRCQTIAVKVGGAYHSTFREIPRLPLCILAIDPLVSADAKDSVHVSWWDVVREYSRRTLSFPADKLVACAGLADEYQAVLGSEYLAGLWRDSLLHDLFWRINGSIDEEMRGSRPEQYRAPSWSWASLDGAIHWFPFLIHQEVATVVECTVTVEDERVPLGRVTDGRLVLRAPLIRGRPQLTDFHWWHLQIETADEARSCHHSEPAVNHDIADPRRLAFVSFDTEADRGLDRMWAVPILVDSSNDMNFLVVALDDAGTTTRLAAESEDGRPVYRRIGCCSTELQNMHARGWDDMCLQSERSDIVIV
ncbi:heterokaryon incompatibility protein-domain-containing protein [Trametes polyzona]|nr:heterokaryon incompatibility protein-domain-containing protein [Trametes polyzona]